ncbi:hypothetical protein EI94DRAFT_1808256 [Lactarius quietus]|nr:hypothetical protein EI94DRAFT_1808256 [Lactarius quietus]
MDAEQTRRRIPDIKFRVLIIGRANAGKTTILQRVCDTTESPTIYRGREVVELNPSVNRGEHLIDDELVFSNHEGYVFHDSKGIEAGGVLRSNGWSSTRTRFEFYDKICPDPNVPVIAVFTKYDQFLCNVEMDMFDEPDKYPEGDVVQVAEKLFQDHYLRPLGANGKYVRLGDMQKSDSRCDVLVEETAAALNEDAVALMLLAVQKGNIGLSVKEALRR